MDAAWANFFVAQVGASAALLGLLFVSVSLNLERILANASLPRRAMLALVMILNVLVVSSLALVPGQPVALLGAEATIAGLAITALAYRTRAQRRSAVQTRVVSAVNAVLLELAVLPYLIGGVGLLLGFSSGLYWLAAGMVVAFIKAVADAWVLLVEINR